MEKLVSRWFLIDSPEPLIVQHDATVIEPGESKHSVRAKLRKQGPPDAKVLSRMGFDEVVDYVWAIKHNEWQAIKEVDQHRYVQRALDNVVQRAIPSKAQQAFDEAMRRRKERVDKAKGRP